jgi:hypothetical protein
VRGVFDWHCNACRVQLVYIYIYIYRVLQVMFPSACSFIVCWFPLYFATCFGIHGHLQVRRIYIYIYIYIYTMGFAGYVSVCVQLYCMLVSTVFHYMFRPTWPSSVFFSLNRSREKQKAAIYRQQKVLSHFPVCCWIDWLLMIKNCLIESGPPCTYH